MIRLMVCNNGSISLVQILKRNGTVLDFLVRTPIDAACSLC